MVKQTEAFKTSSSKPPHVRTGYQFWSEIKTNCCLPAIIKTEIGPESSTGEQGYVISGSLRKEDGAWNDGGEEPWSEPPHIAFANLHADDPRAAEAFIKRYGLLDDLPELDAGVRVRTDFSFRFEGFYLRTRQHQLQQAWQDSKAWVDEHGKEQKGYTWPIEEIEQQVEEFFDVSVVVDRGRVALWPKHLWALICFLFLHDYTAGRLGICENPDCPARYFVKKRRTQRFCEQGPCVQYAQRKYSLDWWKREGKKRREERQRQRRKQRQRRVGKHSAKSKR